jgi:hypothetical protein
MLRALGCLVAASFALLVGGAAFADDDPGGTVVEARGGDAPLFLWDATPLVIDIVKTKRPRGAALRELEVRAVGVLADQMADEGAAKRLTVRVLYRKIGAVNPIYGTPALQGIERVFELSVDAGALRGRRQAIVQTLGDGKSSPDAQVVVSGALPPL